MADAIRRRIAGLERGGRLFGLRADGPRGFGSRGAKWKAWTTRSRFWSAPGELFCAAHGASRLCRSRRRSRTRICSISIRPTASRAHTFGFNGDESQGFGGQISGARRRIRPAGGAGGFWHGAPRGGKNPRALTTTTTTSAVIFISRAAKAKLTASTASSRRISPSTQRSLRSFENLAHTPGESFRAQRGSLFVSDCGAAERFLAALGMNSRHDCGGIIKDNAETQWSQRFAEGATVRTRLPIGEKWRGTSGGRAAMRPRRSPNCACSSRSSCGSRAPNVSKN